MSQEWQLPFSCRNGLGREAKAMVVLRDGALMVISPPGETIRFEPGELSGAIELHRQLSAWIAQQLPPLPPRPMRER